MKLPSRSGYGPIGALQGALSATVASLTVDSNIVNMMVSQVVAYCCHAVCEGNPMMTPSNATFDCGVTSNPGDVCNATCDQGFSGAPSSTCGDDGQWGAVNGTCEPTLIGM